MDKAPAFRPPMIEEPDIRWVSNIMELPADAFTGPDGNDPRSNILKSVESLDVEACPGSGKTTLLVAKLAILANKWTHRRRGICVLSHTNAARSEIEGPLSSCSAGNALVRYPHFVGTIHSFVNEFLAVPWLRSHQFPIRAIDDDICLNVRWNKLGAGTRNSLIKSRHDKQVLRYVDAGFGVGNIKWGRGQLGTDTPIYREMVSACKHASLEGFFCHDEMFVWAKTLLDLYPGIIEAIRCRFPLVFIDEVQDNSESQSTLLHRLFSNGQCSVVRQRFGDSNQAIFDRPGQTEGVQTDTFPGPLKKDLPNSFRFGQTIADHANPLAVVPQALIGQGPTSKAIPTGSRQNTVILFNEQNILDVLPAYAAYLLATFSVDELASGVFTAVSAVHTPKETTKLPHFLGQYAPSYDPEIGRKSVTPKSFIQYIASVQRELLSGRNVHPLVSKAATGILRLAQIANPELSLPQRKSTHRHVLELLENNPEVLRSYVALVDHLILCRGELTQAYWNAEQKVCVTQIAQVIAGMPAASEECISFLEWTAPPTSIGTPQGTKNRENVYRYPLEKPLVTIRLGSIHSVKGETHTATLVLESFHHSHHLKTLKPWLLGQKSGGNLQTTRIQGRLRLHYVAMTRPSHLLGLAMRRDTFDESEIGILTSRGWHIIVLT